MKYRVRLVLEFEDRPSPADGGDGSARWVELDPTGDPAFAGAELLSAVLEEDAAFRVAGHLSRSLREAIVLEGGCPNCGDASSVPCLRCELAGAHGGSCYHVDPDARCESPVPSDPEDEAYCPRAGVLVVELVESRSRIAVCSPCGEALWARGEASEPLEGTGAAVFADPDVVAQAAGLEVGMPATGPR